MANFKQFWSKYGATILTTVSVGCGIAAPIWAAYMTPKAIACMDAASKELGRELTPAEKVKASWKSYIGPVAVASVGVGCSIASNGVNASTIKQLGETCNNMMAQAAAFEEAAKEKISDKKMEEIKQIADKSTVETANSSVVRETGYGDALFIDKMTGQVFRSSVEKIRSVENDINAALFNHQDVYLAQYYTFMGLRQIDPDMAWIRGWTTNLDNAGLVRPVHIIISHTEQLDDGTPVGIVEFDCDSRPKFLR